MTRYDHNRPESKQGRCSLATSLHCTSHQTSHYYDAVMTQLSRANRNTAWGGTLTTEDKNPSWENPGEIGGVLWPFKVTLDSVICCDSLLQQYQEQQQDVSTLLYGWVLHQKEWITSWKALEGSTTRNQSVFPEHLSGSWWVSPILLLWDSTLVMWTTFTFETDLQTLEILNFDFPCLNHLLKMQELLFLQLFTFLP